MDELNSESEKFGSPQSQHIHEHDEFARISFIWSPIRQQRLWYHRSHESQQMPLLGYLNRFATNSTRELYRAGQGFDEYLRPGEGGRKILLSSWPFLASPKWRPGGELDLYYSKTLPGQIQVAAWCYFPRTSNVETNHLPVQGSMRAKSKKGKQTGEEKPEHNKNVTTITCTSGCSISRRKIVDSRINKTHGRVKVTKYRAQLSTFCIESFCCGRQGIGTMYLCL